MYLEIKKTAINQAIRWGEFPLIKYSQFLLLIFLLAGIFCILMFSQAVLGDTLEDKAINRFLGGGIIGILMALFFWHLNFFAESRLKKPKLFYTLNDLISQPEEFNLAEFLDYDALKILKASHRLKAYDASAAIVAALAQQKNRALFFAVNRSGIDLKVWFKIAQEKITNPSLENQTTTFSQIVWEAAKIAQLRGRKIIGSSDLLIAANDLNIDWQNFLSGQHLQKNDIKHLVNWQERIAEEYQKQKCFWDERNLKKQGDLGKDWSSGYTITLDRFVVDYVMKARRSGFRKVIGHENEIRGVERIMGKKERNNVLLVGEPGVGRKSIVEAIAQKAFFAESVPAINDKRVLLFDVSLLASSITSFEEAESMLDKCFAEAVRAGNVILVIDELQNFVTSESKAGIINIAAILGRYLPLQSFKIIAITSYEGLHKFVERNASLLNQFEKVEVGEISAEETMIMLENYYVPYFEFKSHRGVDYNALKAIVHLSTRFIPQLPLPDKAIRLFDEATAYMSFYTSDNILLEKHVRKVLSDKTQIPLEELEEQEKEKLLNMENLLRARVIGQDEALKEVSSALRRARADVKTKSGPIGTFLFLGPTGVGKTETCKALANVYFGSEQRMVRIDMTEFQNTEDIVRLIGSNDMEGLLTTAVRESPFALVLLDEMEKAHPNILNLFLQVLDEGFITDGIGRKVDFSNTIIIATSNAGAEFIRQDLAADAKMDTLKDELLDKLMKEQIFRPEFLNRFDAVVLFHPLSQDSLMAIAQIQLAKIALNLKDKGITLEITKSLKEQVVDLSFNPAFGAREMRRVIQDKIENVLANALLGGIIKRGDHISITPPDFKLVKISAL